MRRAAATRDGLHRVQAYRTDALYVLPGTRSQWLRPASTSPRSRSSTANPRPGERVNEFRPAGRERFEADVARELNAALEGDSGWVAAEAAGRRRVACASPVRRPVAGRPPATGFGLEGGRLPPRPEVSPLSRRCRFGHPVNLSCVRWTPRTLHPASLGRRRSRPVAWLGRAPHNQPPRWKSRPRCRQTVGNRARLLRESLDRVRAAGVMPEPRSSTP